MQELSWLIFILSSIVIASYFFDAIASTSKVPSVILLIIVGLGARILCEIFHIHIASIDGSLPILGTLGLILIVLEGALDLKLSRDKIGVMSRAALSAILGLVLISAAVAALLHWAFTCTWQQALLYAIPTSVISSAIAIPAARALSADAREFVIYESSLSDIIGILLFYLVLENHSDIGAAATYSGLTLLISFAIGLSAALLLYWLISKIETHVRYLPLIAGIALLYAVGKLLHLAPLVIVLTLGLALNNINLMQRLPLVNQLSLPAFENEFLAFKQLVTEATFVVRTYFFVLLGFSTQFNELSSPWVWLIGLAITAIGLLIRAPLLMLVNHTRTFKPLLWFAPKGLITILLIISIPKELQLAHIPEGAIMIMIFVSAILLAYGNLKGSSALNDDFKEIMQPDSVNDD